MLGFVFLLWMVLENFGFLELVMCVLFESDCVEFVGNEY